MHKKTPSSTRKTKSSVIPLSLPPPFSLELESNGVSSPIDHLLEMCQQVGKHLSPIDHALPFQAIPVKSTTVLPQLVNDEHAPPAQNIQVSPLVALLTAKPPPARGQKRKLTKVGQHAFFIRCSTVWFQTVPFSESIIPSSVETSIVSSPQNSATPTLIPILNDSPVASTPENNELLSKIYFS